jgi:hypothetical protein
MRVRIEIDKQDRQVSYCIARGGTIIIELENRCDLKAPGIRTPPPPPTIHLTIPISQLLFLTEADSALTQAEVAEP